MIRSWVLGNEAHENRNGVLLFFLLLCVSEIYNSFYERMVIFMLDLDLFDALETISLMDDYEFEKTRLEFEKNGYILKRDKNGDTDITVEKK